MVGASGWLVRHGYFLSRCRVSSSEPLLHYVIRSEVDESLSTFSSEEVASGLAAVWARENTREALFDAMRRKEVYATTGTRIMVRVFGGWDFEADEVQRPDFADQGYALGVPMGGELTDAPSGVAPSFMIRALRDADGANLDRVQVVKGWLDGGGETHERIYDVGSRTAEPSAPMGVRERRSAARWTSLMPATQTPSATRC